ncbi:hypothetical protein BDR26DRAFT_866366 [Obelidium mucronatum]|nr:hypothetical protein BDR26DRAFT_866366 [Obelidium mucronatum]
MDAFFATDDKTKYVLMLIRKKIELQANAAPGEIYISKSIIDATKKRLDFYWESMKKPQSAVSVAATSATVDATASSMKNASVDVSKVTETGSPAFTSKTRDQQTSAQSTGSVVKLQPTESRSKDATPSPKSSKSTPPAVVAVPKAVTVGINNTKKKSLSPASISTVDKNERKKRSAELSMNLEELKQLRLASLEALASSEKLPEPTASGFKNSTQITETTSEAVTDTGVDVLNGSTSPVQQLPTTFSEVDSPQKSQTKNDAIKDAFISRSSDSEQRNVVVSPKRKGSFEESESKQDQPHSSSELKSSLLRQEPTESTKPTAEHPQPIRHMSDTSSSNSDSAPIPLEKKRRLTSVPLHADTTTAVHSSHSKGFSQEQVNAGLDRLLLLNPKLEPPIPLADVQQLLPKMKNVEKIKTIVELLNAALTERLQKRKRSEVSAKSGQEQNEKDKDDNHESDRKRAKVAEDSVKNPLPAPIATGVAVGQTVNPLFEPLPVSHLPSSPTQSENAYDSFGLSSQNQADLILALGGSSSPRPSTGHQSATGVSADLASGTGVSFAPVITPSVPTFAPDPQPSNPYLSVSIPMPHDVELLLEKINRIAQSPLETLPRFGVFLPTNKVKPNEPLIVGEFVWVPVIICPTIKYNKISIQVKGQSPVKLDLEPISNKAVYWPAVVKNVCKTILDSSVCEVWKAPILVDELDLDAVALSQAAEPLSTGKHVVRQVSGVHELELLEFPELPVFMEAKHLVKKEQMEVTPEYVLQLRGAGTWEEVVQIDYIGLVFEKYLKSLCAIAGK